MSKYRAMLLVGLASTLGYANQGAMPWVIGAFVDQAGLSQAQAGLLGTVELGVMGLAMLAIAPFAPALPRRSSIAVGLAGAIGAECLTILMPSFVLLVLLRALCGLAFALLFTIGAAEGGRSAEPVRTFAAAGLMTLTLGAGKVLLLGWSKQYGIAGVMLMMSGWCLALGLPVLCLLWRAPEHRVVRTDAGEIPAATLIFTAITAMAVVGLYSFATGGVWAFVQQVATRVGLRDADLASGIAAVGLTGVVGGIAAERLGERWGRAFPTIAALVASGTACLFVMTVSSRLEYWIAMTAWIIIYWFSYPYMLAFGAFFDPQGRLTAGLAGIMILTAAAGIATAGIFTDYFGPASFGWTALIVCAAAAVVTAILFATVKPQSGPTTFLLTD